MRSLVFRVRGRVTGQGSKNRGRGGHFYESSPYLEEWRGDVRDAAGIALKGAPEFDTDAEAYSVEIVFAVKRPQHHYIGNNRNNAVRPSAPLYCPTSPDIDKAARAVLDALTHAKVYPDDRRVVVLQLAKCYADKRTQLEPGAAVVVYPTGLDGKWMP